MRCLGRYVPPIVTSLPASGQEGQEVIYQGRVHLWNAALSKWEPELSHHTIRLVSDIVEAAAVFQPMFLIPVEANALYEIDMLLLHQQSSAAQLRIRSSGPTGWMPHTMGAFAQATDGAGWVTNWNQNNAGTMSPGNIYASWANKPLRSRIAGTIITVNSGNVLYEVNSNLAGSTTTIFAGSFVSYRRVA